MTRFRHMVNQLAARVLPWPTRAERAAAIQTARSEKETSQRDLATAQAVLRTIERYAKDNHIAEKVARQIMEGGK